MVQLRKRLQVFRFLVKLMAHFPKCLILGSALTLTIVPTIHVVLLVSVLIMSRTTHAIATVATSRGSTTHRTSSFVETSTTVVLRPVV